ncbi:MAG: hypothetical protein IPN04_05415 [Rhodoferax sp.]|nr:hypothetical protein [Rhodoferax sp.]
MRLNITVGGGGVVSWAQHGSGVARSLIWNVQPQLRRSQKYTLNANGAAAARARDKRGWLFIFPGKYCGRTIIGSQVVADWVNSPSIVPTS